WHGWRLRISTSTRERSTLGNRKRQATARRSNGGRTGILPPDYRWAHRARNHAAQGRRHRLGLFAPDSAYGDELRAGGHLAEGRLSYLATYRGQSSRHGWRPDRRRGAEPRPRRQSDDREALQPPCTLL